MCIRDRFAFSLTELNFAIAAGVKVILPPTFATKLPWLLGFLFCCLISFFISFLNFLVSFLTSFLICFLILGAIFSTFFGTSLLSDVDIYEILPLDAPVILKSVLYNLSNDFVESVPLLVTITFPPLIAFDPMTIFPVPLSVCSEAVLVVITNCA